jgi:hypothetical protein
VLLITGFSLLWKSWRAAASYLICYMGLLLMWPWPGGRLLAPILPFALLAFLLGAWHWAARLPPLARAPVLGVLVAALSLGAVPAILKQHAIVRHCDRAHPLSDPECYPGPKGGIVRAGEYLRLHVPTEKVVLAQSPVSVHFLSGHQAESVRLIGLAPPDSVMNVLRDWKIEFILVSDFQKFARGPAARALLSHCRQLWVEASFPPHALLLTTVPQHDPSPNACAVLTEFSRGPAEESDDP